MGTELKEIILIARCIKEENPTSERLKTQCDRIESLLDKVDNGNLKEQNPMLDAPICCPVCKSDNISDISTYQSNGLCGSGFSKWKTSDMRSCENCGVVFKPVKTNRG